MVKKDLHPKNTMVTVWWSSIGIIHYEFLKPGTSITLETYCSQIDTFYNRLSEKWPALTNQKNDPPPRQHLTTCWNLDHIKINHFED